MLNISMNRVQFGAEQERERSKLAQNGSAYRQPDSATAQQASLQQLEQGTLAKLKEAQAQPFATRKLTQAKQALQELTQKLTPQAVTPEKQHILQSIQEIQQFDEAISTAIFKAGSTPGASGKPHKMDAFETAAVLDMILDLVHSETVLAQNARQNLSALGLSVNQLDKLTAKLREEQTKAKAQKDLIKINGIKFSGQSLNGMIQEALKTIQENNTVFEVMDKVTDHYLFQTESIIPTLLFGFAFDATSITSGTNNISLPLGSDVTIGETQLYLPAHSAAYDSAFSSSVDQTWNDLNARIGRMQARNEHFAYLKMLQKNGMN